MSTLRVASINNPAAASGGLAISATGAVSGAGLDHIVTETFTAASSVSVDDCFSADYDNYRIIMPCAMSGSNQIQFRMRASGADATGNDYAERFITSGGAGTSMSAGATTSTLARLALGGSSSPYPANVAADIYAPNLASRTYVHSVGFPSYLVTLATMHNLTTAYDGITVFADTGTITGSLSVYGYKS